MRGHAQRRGIQAKLHTFGKELSANHFKAFAKQKIDNIITHSEELKHECDLPEAYIIVNGKKPIFIDSEGKERTAKSNNRISRVLHLKHKPSLKQHYPTALTRPIEVPRGRYNVGMSRISETELLSMMMMQKPMTCAMECLGNSDMSHVQVCLICRAVLIYCDCPNSKSQLTKVMVREPAVKMNVPGSTSMLDYEKLSPMTLGFVCENGSRRS
ncbi:hypothetical protein NX059_012437 [Plenodomus lindquistii]|nr:hypothetical protein NX059_012437 [Plenodomus lindquistii]